MVNIATGATSPSSWNKAFPNGVVINNSPSGDSIWWTNLNSGTYYPSEKSAVNGPCFNLLELPRPMFAFDYWSDAEQNLDGAALQYSIDGGLHWEIVGPAASSPDEGIEWYNGQVVQSNPGDQPLGWTGKQTGWKNARFNLDMIPMSGREQVRLRVVFSSNSTNDPNKTFDGFAFDNVFVGNKKRNVMVEYFTNREAINDLSNDYFDNLFRNHFEFPVIDFENYYDSSDFFKIQYHIANIASDNINRDNPVDPLVRSLFYGATKPPVGIMDGLDGLYYGRNLNGAPTQIELKDLDRRALVDPLFDIEITELPTLTNDSLHVSVKFTYIDSVNNLTTPVSLQLVLIEDIGTTGLRNIVRKFLLSSEGQIETDVWTRGKEVTVTYKKPIDMKAIGSNNTKLYLAAFVQDRITGTRTVHQAEIKKLSTKSSSTITGIDNPELAEVKDISMFPNPATQYINFASENQLTRDYQFTIVDQRGVTVLTGNLNRDLSIPQQVELSGIADGVYIVMIHYGNKRLTQRKLAVLKR